MQFSNQAGGFSRPPVQMQDVSNLNITCKDCGASITELPFNPDPSRLDQLRCRDCMRNLKRSKGPARRRF